MPDSPPLQLPTDLKARLKAAGVSDQASLEAALAADPALKTDFEAFLIAQQPAHPTILSRSALDELIAVRDREELVALVQRTPYMLEDDFFRLVQQAITEAEAASETSLAAGLRQRLESLRQLRQIQNQAQDSVQQALEALIGAKNRDDLTLLARQAPFVLEDDFLNALAQIVQGAEEAGEINVANAIRQRLQELRALRR